MKHVEMSKYIDLCRIQKGVTVGQLAERLGQSASAMRNDFNYGTFKLARIEQVADAFNADVEIKFIDRETGEPII